MGPLYVGCVILDLLVALRSGDDANRFERHMGNTVGYKVRRDMHRNTHDPTGAVSTGGAVHANRDGAERV